MQIAVPTPISAMWKNYLGKEQKSSTWPRKWSGVAHNIVGFDKPTIESVYGVGRSISRTLSHWVGTHWGRRLHSPEVEPIYLNGWNIPKLSLGIGLDYHWMTAPKMSKKRFSSSDSIVLRTWTSLCGTYTWCFRRYMPSSREKSRSRWDHAFFLRKSRRSQALHGSQNDDLPLEWSL